MEPAWITLAAVSFLFIAGQLERGDLVSGVDWGLVLYMGFIMSLGPVLNSLGAHEWLQTTVSSALGPVMQNVYLFLACVVLLVYVLRIALANLVTPGILTAVIVGPLAEKAGVHPFIVLIAVGAGALWTPPHINPMYLAFGTSLGGRGLWTLTPCVSISSSWQ